MEEAWSFPSLSSGKTGLQHPQTQPRCSEADSQGLAAPSLGSLRGPGANGIQEAATNEQSPGTAAPRGYPNGAQAPTASLGALRRASSPQAGRAGFLGVVS